MLLKSMKKNIAKQEITINKSMKFFGENLSLKLYQIFYQLKLSLSQ